MKKRNVKDTLPGYYKAKLELQELIKSHLEKGVRRESLYFLAKERYGFGKAPVDSYLSLLQDQGLVKSSDGPEGEVLRF